MAGSHKQLLLAVLLCCAAGSAAAANPAPDAEPVKVIRQGSPHEALYDLAFEGHRGTAVGGFGAVLTSSDAGQSWSQLWSAPKGQALFGVVQRYGRCVAVGQHGAVFQSDDCWRWKETAAVTTARLTSVSMNRNGQAYAVGAFGTIIKSGDWGQSWSAVVVDWSRIGTQGTEPHLYAVDVRDNGDVTIAGEFELIMRQQGNQWVVLHQGEASLFGLQLLDNGTGYAVGQSGAVLATVDGGSSWRALDSGTKAILTGVAATPSGEVLATGINTVMASRDRGKTWRAIRSTLVNNGWHQAAAVSESEAGERRLMTVGAGGLILQINIDK